MGTRVRVRFWADVVGRLCLARQSSVFSLLAPPVEQANSWHESKKIMEISKAFIIPRSLHLAFILLCTYRR